MELITTHTHTTFCAHARDSIADMVDAAWAAHITTMAVTEHYPLTLAIDPREYVSMKKERVGEYLSEIERQRQLHPDMEILTGCELDWLGVDEDRDLTDADFEPFDIILGSVHFVDRWPFDDPAQQGHWEYMGADEIWRRYFEVYCDAATSTRPFTVMSHPDLVKKFDYYPNFDPSRLYKRAADATQAGGRMIELNTSGKYYACKEVFPGPQLLEEFCRAGVPCTIGTDAHEVAHVARGIEDAYKTLYEAGYREVTVPTRDGDRRTIPIE